MISKGRIELETVSLLASHVAQTTHGVNTLVGFKSTKWQHCHYRVLGAGLETQATDHIPHSSVKRL